MLNTMALYIVNSTLICNMINPFYIHSKKNLFFKMNTTIIKPDTIGFYKSNYKKTRFYNSFGGVNVSRTSRLTAKKREAEV